MDEFLEQGVEMNSQLNYLTLDGKKKLEAELEYLTTTARRNWPSDCTLHQARRPFGERRLFQSQRGSGVSGRPHQDDRATLRNLVIVEEVRNEETADGAVRIGSTVKVVEEGFEDARRSTGLSVDGGRSQARQDQLRKPVRQGLIGKHVGDQVTVQAPMGAITFRLSTLNSLAVS